MRVIHHFFSRPRTSTPELPYHPTVPSNGVSPNSISFALRASAMFWFLIALLGQWAFFYFIIAFYGTSVVSGNLEMWNRFEPLGNTPYIPGDTSGNVAFAAHALGAGIVAFGGALQLIPQLRQWAPKFHRWNGRIYLTTVVALALSGFYLNWIRGSSPNTLSAVGSSINGGLILIFAFVALLRVRNGNLSSHRQWAMRLYLVSNAQWFLRVGVICYLMVGRALGFETKLGGWFFDFWTFGCYLTPLLLLQLYLFAGNHPNVILRSVVAGSIVGVTLLMGVGIVGYFQFTRLIITDAPLLL